MTAQPAMVHEELVVRLTAQRKTWQSSTDQNHRINVFAREDNLEHRDAHLLNPVLS